MQTNDSIYALRDALATTVGGFYAAPLELRERAETLQTLAGNGDLDTDLLPAVASLLGRMESEESLRVLRTLAEHPDGVVRQSALSALAFDRIDDGFIYRALTLAELDPDREVRHTAAFAVGSLISGAQESALRRLVEAYETESEEYVRRSHIYALACLLGYDRLVVRNHGDDAEDTPYSREVLAEARRRTR